MAYSKRGMPMPFDFRNGRTDNDWTTGGKREQPPRYTSRSAAASRIPFIHRGNVVHLSFRISLLWQRRLSNCSHPLLMGDTRITMGIAAGGQGVSGRTEETQSYCGELNNPMEGRK
ncbi:hypothetical protein TcCL_ESM08563 [Trypanosoma cruzi]|nr:hypothetical protein TcCL_ESM08563 [Trypanosoma cruzi]